MDSEVYSKLREQLERHEGFQPKPYLCSAGKVTIGFGRNLDDKGISEREANIMLTNDIVDVEADCKSLFPNFDRLNNARKVVLLNMMYNLGKTRLSAFKKFRAAVDVEDWYKASVEMMDSLWASQVKGRAIELSGIMREGKW